ncbi:MAG: dihydroorotate dehydrogenase-like protein [Opitutales bacterium]|jgi:dihydroorotate dehydrogenase (fumarate)
MDLSTSYLGLKLKNPLIAGASPLSFSVDMAKRIEESGASAIVLHSLFEEQLAEHPVGEGAPYHFSPDQYIQHLRTLKRELSIPVIGSLNSIREGAWVRYAQYMQDAGADAIEINLYFLPRTDSESSSVIEQRSFQIIRLVRQFVSIPIAVKLSPWITSLRHFAMRMEEAGASGLVLFNRFIQPDIDINTLKTVSKLNLTTPEDLLLRLHWLSTLSGRTHMHLSASGGIHTSADLVKTIIAGANTAQTVSALILHGPEHIKVLLKGLEAWLEQHHFSGVDDARSKVNTLRKEADKATGRENYIRIVHNWERLRG